MGLSEKLGLRHHDEELSEPPPSYATVPSAAPVAGPSTARPVSQISSYTNGGLSSLPPFASMSLHMTDRVRFVDMPPSVTSAVQQIITEYWPRGIQASRPYGISQEIKLNGTPWSTSGDYGPEAVTSRRLLNRILETLYNHGWIVSLAADISKKEMDKNTMIFRYAGTVQPPPREWMSISLSRSDKIRLIDAPDDLVQAAVSALGGFNVIKKHGPDDTRSGAYKINLIAPYWVAGGESTMVARKVVIVLMQALETRGFSVYAAVDQNSGTEGRGVTDVWHCSRLVNSQPMAGFAP